MPAKSEKQRKMMAIAEHQPEKLFKRNRGVLKMGKKKLSDFASKHTTISPSLVGNEKLFNMVNSHKK